MKRLFFFALLFTIAFAAGAKPVEIAKARLVGQQYLQQRGLLNTDEMLTLAHTYSAQVNGEIVPTMYVFNCGKERFVIVGADDRCVPILGSSSNGCFVYEDLPINMKSWMEECSQSIASGIADNAPDNPEILKRWKDLSTGSNTTAFDTKSDTYLLTSTWEQGDGYNNYCPVWNGNHVLVGCVATAMAQIIRYHQYPSRGFGKKSYAHETYGVQAVDFDTTDYDYSLMPDWIRWRSSAEEIDMVSRLCRHCGIVVNMNYQSATNTSGSGAQTSKVVEGIAHFGYTEAMLMTRTDVSDSLWIATIHHEIDNLRPIEYAGHSEEGGHAFVLDGYNNINEAHFNWGWGGFCDGFYSLNTIMGYSSGQQMVYNIYPSGWDGHLERFHVSPDGNGKGTSWEEANSNIAAAVKLNKLVNRDIWMKEGIYYGDTTADYSFSFNSSATIYGGFAGTETTTGQRNAKQHPTILDGGGQRSILYARCNNNVPQALKIYDIVLQNGYSEKGDVVVVTDNVTTDRWVVRNCQSDSGNIIKFNNTMLRHSIFHSNQAPTILYLNQGQLRQCLINNNDCDDVFRMTNNSMVYDCDIVNNSGVAIKFAGGENTMANNIIWGNSTSYVIENDTALINMHYCAIESDTAFTDSTLVRLDGDNNAANGPRFANPGQRGAAGYNDELDFHLLRGSICIDAGQRIQEHLADGDIDNNLRCRNGIPDIGCYESNYPVSIDAIENSPISLFPNPATNTIYVEGLESGNICIYDIYGRQVIYLPARQSSVDISSLPSGLYILHSGENQIRFIKE